MADLTEVINSVVTDLFGGVLVGSAVEWLRSKLIGYGGYSSTEGMAMRTLELVGLLSADVLLSQMYFNWTESRGYLRGGSLKDLVFLVALFGAQPDLTLMVGEWAAHMKKLVEGNPLVDKKSLVAAESDEYKKSSNQDEQLHHRIPLRDELAETFQRPLYSGY